MKNLGFSMFFLLSLLFFFASISQAAIPCGTVDAKAAACVGFATGKAATPTPACCSGLQQLAQSVKTVDDKKAICRCLKAGAKSLGVQDRFLSKIPDACKIKVGFPVSTSTNCETSVVNKFQFFLDL
ncbi:Non-specific lipid-transfer protein [Melia azedarach]|uniref:Non-specific lipid-transfer protein n=1 Tax=Melia azedarach TaxID=155640 RepID=A0ACC1WY05_MELAZ|nr:Non-specific lipid-transfer protein [Melia azedarach]